MRDKNDSQTLDWLEEIGVAQYGAIINHGTVYAYNKHKCRCEFCKEAKAISNQRAALKRAVAQSGEQRSVIPTPGQVSLMGVTA